MGFKEKLPCKGVASYKSKEISRVLQKIFTANSIEKLAKESGFVKKSSPMTGNKFAHLCIGGIVEKGQMSTLGELCTLAMQLDVAVCEQSLNERFNSRGVAFMKSVFDKVLLQRFDNSTLDVLQSFSQINLEDSTQIKLPEHLESLFKGSGGNASKAMLKIDYTYDLKADNFMLHLRQGRQSDGSMVLPDRIVRESLWLRDLGYFRLDDFAKIEKEKAYYISRFKFKTHVYASADENAEPLDLLGILDGMKANQVRNIMVFVGKTKRFSTRLTLQKVPKEIGDKRRESLKKDKKRKGAKVSKERLMFCDASAFITNLAVEEWTVYQVMKLYKIRWQIEILFKVWKSVLKIGQVRKMKADRFMCLLYGQLIWAVINMRIFQSFKNHFWKQSNIEISELKSYKIMNMFKYQFTQAIYANCRKLLEKSIEQIYQVIKCLGKKQYKKGNPNPLFMYDIYE